MNDTLDDLYRASVRAYGVDAQIAKAAEECGELASAINKWAALAHYRDHLMTLNGEVEPWVNEALDEVWRRIPEEVADVKLMVGQLEYMIGDHDFAPILREKVRRAWERLRRAGVEP